MTHALAVAGKNSKTATARNCIGNPKSKMYGISGQFIVPIVFSHRHNRPVLRYHAVDKG